MAITRETTIPKQQQPNNDNNNTTESTTPTTVSRYEQTREQRIKENRERLQKLGIVDLSLQLKSISSTASRRNPRSQFDRKTPLKSLSLVPSEPSRRSSRLQSAPPISYIEPKEDKSRRRRRDIVLEVGSKPEYYTEEHDKLLGNTEMPWTFFVDGYAADGRRIYDPVNGKTCHQCRQKTLGQRTRCSQCSLVQGQFCGDCLYMRYGEHVVEANQNPNWICPPCRGICNCSLCRQAKGWPPTGSLYRRISDLGYKSVAHYLVATKRAPPEVDTNPDTEQSTKLCLPFEGMEVPSDVADEKGTDSKTEPSQIPEGVRRSGRKSKKENTSDGRELAIISVVAEDQPVCEMESPKRVGRPRKKSKSENIDGGEESVSKDIIENGTDAEMKSPKRVGRPRKQTPEGVRRSGRTSKKEHTSDGRELAIISVVAEDQSVCEMESPKRVGRPRKKSKSENIDSDEESVSKDVIENGTDAEMKSLKRVGRPRKQSKKEIIDGGVETVSKDVIENGSDSKMKSPKAVGRPRKTPAKENIDGGVESQSKDVAENGVDFEMKNRDISSPMTDSVARSLRPRNKNCISSS
ncbi:hypothetical protein RND81_13G201700 [Saponaria officinalis]|uniref:Zinc-finger domain-containing protein n=1 Tax=Saponaria officinalis TaxID=3572 RepID=A0AAW1H233_SAPOF